MLVHLGRYWKENREIPRNTVAKNELIQDVRQNHSNANAKDSLSSQCENHSKANAKNSLSSQLYF